MSIDISEQNCKEGEGHDVYWH